MKRSILLVGGNETELGEVRDELARLAPTWDLLWVPTGVEALNQFTRRNWDAVIADLALGDLTGLQLLGRVLQQWPDTHRLILADLGEPDALLRCVGGVHQFLIRPCDAQRLQVVLERVFSSRIWLPTQAVQPLLGKLPSVPSPASEYHAAVELLENDRLDAAAGVIAADPPMCAKILQLANSAAYGPVLDEADAVNSVRELGLVNVRRTLLLAHTFSAFRGFEGLHFSIEALWEHSRRVARLARRIAETEDAPPDVVTQAATAGLLHDLGKVVLAANLPDHCQRLAKLVASARLTLWDAEMDVFGATQSEVGGTLLNLWGLPMPIVEAVALYRHPARFLSNSFSPLTAVHAATALAGATDFGAARNRLDLDYLGELNLISHIPEWWRLREVEAAVKPTIA